MKQFLTFKPESQQRIMQQLSVIDTFKGSWSVLEQSKSNYLKELRKIATIQSIGSSTRIEGAELTDQEVEKLLSSVKINKLEKRDEQEVIGYYETLEVILENYSDIPLSESYVHQLHGMLLKHSHKDQPHKGKFKNLSNQVAAEYPDGTKRIIFNTTEPHLTGVEMEALLTWVNERLDQQDVHPLLIVSTFVYEFLSIHPYQDGNGRLSRLLTTLLLLKLDYQFVQYVSFEHLIENKKEEYYKALMSGQKNRYQPDEQIDEWTIYFLDRLIELTKKLEEKYRTYSQLKTVLNPRQQLVLDYIQTEGTVQLKDLNESLKKYSRNTLKKDLTYLVDQGLIIRTGAGRGTRYIVKK